LRIFIKSGGRDREASGLDLWGFMGPFCLSGPMKFTLEPMAVQSWEGTAVGVGIRYRGITAKREIC